MLPQNPAFDPCDLVVGHSRFIFRYSGLAMAKDDIEHAEQTDHCIEAVFTVLLRSEAVHDVVSQRICHLDVTGPRPVLHGERVGLPIRLTALRPFAIHDSEAEMVIDLAWIGLGNDNAGL